MQSRTILFAIHFLLSAIGVFSQTSSFYNSNFPEGYSKKYIASSAKKWDKKRVSAFLVDTKGNTYKGQLLHMEDQTLYFYASDSLFYKNPDKDLIYTFSSEEISRIMLKRPVRIREGIIAGAGVALAAPVFAIIEFTGSGEEGWLVLLVPVLYVVSALTTIPVGITAGYMYGISIDYKTNGDRASYKILADELKKYALFMDNVPKGLLPEKKVPGTELTTEELPPYKEKKHDALGYNKLDFGLSVGSIFSFAANDITNSLNKSLPPAFYKSFGEYSPIIDFDFGYRVHKNIRAGLEISGWLYSTSYENYDIENYEEPYTSFSFDYIFTSFAIKCDYIYKPVRRLLSRRSEFSFGVGASTSSCYSFVSEQDFFYNTYADPTDIEFEPQFNSHLDASFAYDLYIFHFLSVRAAVHGQYALKNIEIPSVTLTDVDNIEYTVPKATINTSSLSAEFGLRFHF